MAIGADEVRPFATSPVDFTDDPTMNLADVVKDYGQFLPDDIRFDVAVFPELYHSIDLLQKTAPLLRRKQHC